MGVLVVSLVAVTACGNALHGATQVGVGNAGRLHDLESGPSYEVKVATVGNLGPILVNGQGLTLYLFEPDHRGRSSCYQECAFQWPPLTLPAGVTRPIAGAGVHAALLSSTVRTDGTSQITYDGWPLYRWLPDSAPGQATGQGLNNLGGLWWVVDPSGAAVTG